MATTESGHWITLEDGRHIFIADNAGHVPRRLRAEGDTRFSKAHLERHLVEHHERVTGGTRTVHDEQRLQQAAGAGDPFTFHKKLPTEVKEFMQGRPELRRLFKTTNNPAEAGGADAFGEMGDRYLDLAEQRAGSPLRAAKATAHASNDPEVKFLAAVHDNLPEGRFSGQTINAKGLRVGDEFAIGGSKFRVAEDDSGMRVLEGGKDYPETPVDALDQLPIDKGSLKQGKRRRQQLEDAPFSRAIILPEDQRCYGFREALTLGQDLPKERNGEPCFYYWKESLLPGTWTDSRGVVDTYTPERIDGIVRSFERQKEKDLLPFITPNHKVRDGDRNLGYIQAARKNSRGGLELLHQFVGEDAKKAAARNGTSICLLKRFKTQDGEIINDFIDHNAALPDPSIPFLKDFEPAFVASRCGEVDAEVLQFASERSEAMPLTPQQKERLQKLVPAGAQLPDEPTPDYFLGLIETTATAKTGEVTAALSRATAAEGKVAEFSRQQQPTPPTASEVYWASRAVKGERLKAIQSGAITPAVADKLEARLLGKPAEYDKITLSRQTTADDISLSAGFARLLDVYESLDGNQPAPRTGAGPSHLLSREVPGDDAAASQQIADDARKQAEKWKEEQLKASGKV